MSKAEEILSQQATMAQIRRWAEGNAIEREYWGNVAYYLYHDGSLIVSVSGKLTAYP